MIYVCVAAQNDAPTVGLLLWKVRQVFTEYRREYELLVADDASTDGTAELLDRYQRVLPMSVLRSERRTGYARALETLLREAVRRSDRHKRDAAVVLPPDFAVSPAVLPDLVKRLESGADVVIGDALDSEWAFGARMVRRSAPWLLRPGIRIPGVRDVLSGCGVFRLITLRRSLRVGQPLLESTGHPARAELLARTIAEARQIAEVRIPARRTRHTVRILPLAWQLYRMGRRLRIRPDRRARESA